MQLEPLKPKVDQRGMFVEAFKLPNDGQVSYLFVNPGETRGNHYHTRKTEYFVLLRGSAIVSVRDRESGNVMKVEVSDIKPMSIKIAPNNTHRFTATSEGCIFVVWCTEQFNEDDPDTYPEEL